MSDLAETDFGSVLEAARDSYRNMVRMTTATMATQARSAQTTRSVMPIPALLECAERLCAEPFDG